MLSLQILCVISKYVSYIWNLDFFCKKILLSQMVRLQKKTTILLTACYNFNVLIIFSWYAICNSPMTYGSANHDLQYIFFPLLYFRRSITATPIVVVCLSVRPFTIRRSPPPRCSSPRWTQATAANTLVSPRTRIKSQWPFTFWMLVRT